jgi:hypothetical protein
LIDPRELDGAIEEFLTNPKRSLDSVATSKADPVLIQDARQLLDALLSAAPAEAKLAARAYETVSTLLEGQSPASLATAAETVGLLARDAGFFRPADAWPAFHNAIDDLSSAVVVDPSVANGVDLGVALKGQRATRDINRLARALAFVKHAMDETRRECQRGEGGAGNVSALRAQVKSQVQEVARLANSLGRKSGHGD